MQLREKPHSDGDAPPLVDEVEVSVFGPGYGEAVLVHLCDDEWLVIDSCRNRKTDRPMALEYLENLGVEFADRVRLIVATHWHDDHVGGLAEIVEACPRAPVAISQALRNDEFLQLIGTAEATLLIERHTSGIKELDG